MSTSGLLEAFMALRPALIRFLMSRGAQEDEAQDILQDISVKLATVSGGGVEQPRAYLYSMANNHLLLLRRSAGRRGRREEAWFDIQGGDPPGTDNTPSAEAALIAREQVVRLQHVLDRLPERTRNIFQSFRIEGQSQRAIAADLGISVSAVEKHLARAYDVITAEKKKLDGEMTPSRSLSNGRGQYGD